MLIYLDDTSPMEMDVSDDTISNNQQIISHIEFSSSTSIFLEEEQTGDETDQMILFDGQAPSQKLIYGHTEQEHSDQHM